MSRAAITSTNLVLFCFYTPLDKYKETGRKQTCPLSLFNNLLFFLQQTTLQGCLNMQIWERRNQILKTTISCPLLCIFTKCIDFKKTLQKFQSEIYDFSRFLLLRGYFGKALRCMALNDFPSKEFCLYLEVQSELNLF